MSLRSLNVAHDFEAWASLAARLRVASAQERRMLLRDAGLETTWDATHEGWARTLNAEIAAGQLERPERYLARCAEEATRVRGAASVTLPGFADEDTGGALPFASSVPPPPSSGPASNEAAAAFFARLRASAPNVVPPPPRARAHTMPVLGSSEGPPTERPTSSGGPAALHGLAPDDRFLADFRASLMPPAPVARPAREQTSTVVAPAPSGSSEVGERVRALARDWTGDRLAAFLDSVARARTPAEALELWRQAGIETTAEQEYVRSTFALRLEGDPGLAWRWRDVAASVRRGP
ncbi:MAG: hypothetical protein FJ096_13210 [Deltaproteobacteria bacterium]|nr:hypothetical protein [Deltaproteobacteria bacterium]